MNEQDILRGLYDETLAGNGPAVLDLTNRGLELGLAPETMLFDALIPALEEVGARFERGDFFVPEMLIAGKAMAGAMEVLRPLLAQTGASSIGTFVMGTVKGDVHDIGKNLVNIMLEGAGFTVIDLGVQVPPERFVERGSYCFVRSPMYLGVILLVVGQGLLLGREILYLWAVAAWLIFTSFLVFYEEQQLRLRFGDDYDDYRARVRRWLPTRPRSSRY